MLHARKVLSDCRRAHDLLEMEEDENLFRLLWVAGVSLARTVGHVLDKVDGESDPHLADVIRSRYGAWKQDRHKSRIFWDFIEDERNRLLKEYEVGFLSGAVKIVAAGEMFELDDGLLLPIADGTFAGEDCRDVLKEAVDWWDAELNEIEREFSISLSTKIG